MEALGVKELVSLWQGREEGRRKKYFHGQAVPWEDPGFRLGLGVVPQAHCVYASKLFWADWCLLSPPFMC